MPPGSRASSAGSPPARSAEGLGAATLPSGELALVRGGRAAANHREEEHANPVREEQARCIAITPGGRGDDRRGGGDGGASTKEVPARLAAPALVAGPPSLPPSQPPTYPGRVSVAAGRQRVTRLRSAGGSGGDGGGGKGGGGDGGGGRRCGEGSGGACRTGGGGGGGQWWPPKKMS